MVPEVAAPFRLSIAIKSCGLCTKTHPARKRRSVAPPKIPPEGAVHLFVRKTILTEFFFQGFANLKG